MQTLRIEILNPKAEKLLRNMADLKLIHISREDSKKKFLALLKKMRKADVPSVEEITKEVEIVRSKRYGKRS